MWFYSLYYITTLLTVVILLYLHIIDLHNAYLFTYYYYLQISGLYIAYIIYYCLPQQRCRHAADTILNL
jgi:hypothetical protein